MVFRHISTDLKERALWLLEHDYIPEDVCEILGISHSSIYCTVGSTTKPSMVMLSLLRIHYKVDHTFSLLIKLMNSDLLSVTPLRCIWMKFRTG